MRNFILKSALCLGVIAICVSSAFAQEQKSGDILILKSGLQLVGKITSITENDVTIELEKGGSTTIQLTDVDPTSAYKIKQSRIDQNNANEHLWLGDFAFKSGLYTITEQEYNKALELDETLKETVTKKLDDVGQTYAKALFDEGSSLMKGEKIEDAVKKFAFVLDKYPQSPYAGQAKEELARATDLIKERAEKRLQELEEAKRKLAEQKDKEEAEKLRKVFEQGIKLIDDAKAANADGLGWESKGNITAALRAYQKAEASLSEAKNNIDAVIASAKDEDVIKVAQEKLKEIDKFLVVVYGNVGNMYAMLDNFTEALVWLNKALAIDPFDKFAKDLKTAISEARIRMRSQQPQYQQQQTPR